jgi:hypothetical protein
MLKFKEVSYGDLMLGNKYIIQDATYNKIYIGIFNGYSNQYTLNEISYWGKTFISYLTNINKKYLIGNVEMNKYTTNRKYLVLESQKDIIQNNMENRALHIILRRLLGDNLFTL